MNTPPWQDQDSWPAGTRNQNTASDNAHVDQQIGTIVGDAAFHRHESVYHINQEDPPERKHEVALNHLAGGTPRFAEELLGELLRAGHATTERAYHYALAVLSERSLNEIDGEIFSAVVYAYRTCVALPADGWRKALEVVWQLLWCMRREVDGPLDAGGLQRALDGFAALPADRQAEVTRHLDMVLVGVIQDRLDAANATNVVGMRMRPARVRRAWKFFQPDPARPRRFEPAVQRPAPAELLKTWLGGAAVLLGVVLLVPALGRGGALLGTLLLLGGGYVLVRFGAAAGAREIRLTAKAGEHQPPAGPRPPAAPGHWVSTAFVKEVHGLVDKCFREARPHVAGDWTRDTQGIRRRLADRFVALYGNAKVPPATIAWLIRWHADRVAARYRNGSLHDHAALAGPASTALLFRVGVVISAIGVFAVMGAAPASALYIGVGGFFAARGLIAQLAARRAAEWARTEADELFAEENAAHGRWVATLADRPTDKEMALWLAMDKSYLKTAALKKAGLTNRDLVAHVVMTEGVKGAMRARVLHGPPRYSKYVVLVFLLTNSGVREIRVDLDFLDGKVHDERRNAFRYESLASASVAEAGVRTANERRFTAPPTGSDPVGSDPAGSDPAEPEPWEVERLRSRAFRLTLVSGEDISVVVENLRGISDAALEDESELLRLALETSGVAGALHVLEAVAAEGPDWINREHERRRRWSRDWYDGMTEAA